MFVGRKRSAVQEKSSCNQWSWVSIVRDAFSFTISILRKLIQQLYSAHEIRVEGGSISANRPESFAKLVNELKETGTSTLLKFLKEQLSNTRLEEHQGHHDHLKVTSSFISWYAVPQYFWNNWGLQTVMSNGWTRDWCGRWCNSVR